MAVVLWKYPRIVIMALKDKLFGSNLSQISDMFYLSCTAGTRVTAKKPLSCPQSPGWSFTIPTKVSHNPKDEHPTSLGWSPNFPEMVNQLPLDGHPPSHDPNDGQPP